jgi:hypothetical protein
LHHPLGGCVQVQAGASRTISLQRPEDRDNELT